MAPGESPRPVGPWKTVGSIGERLVSQELKRILVADDEPNLREALRLLFERNGFGVLIAEDGQEAVEIAEREQPDVIVLDVMMPRMDGYEACRNLRAHSRTRHIPILMLTAKTTEDDKIVGLEGGANDYVTKPWTSRELVQRVRNHIAWAESQRAVSPLTGLPGTVTFLEERQRRVDAGQAFAQVLIDLDYFKSFNDYYGFPLGDVAIRAVADELVRVIEAEGRKGDFLGHVGGDDFLVLTTPERGETLGEEIKEGLVPRLPALYEDDDMRRGFVRVRNRRNHQYANFPLMSVTIAVAIYKPESGMHLAQFDAVLSELKQYGKGIPGSVVVTERRRAEEDAIAGAERPATTRPRSKSHSRNRTAS